MTNERSLQVAPDRLDIIETGIYVRALNEDKKWESVDISHLDRDSLQSWLRSRGGENQWAENVVMILLGHEPMEAA